MRLSARGEVPGLVATKIGRVSRGPRDASMRADYFLLINRELPMLSREQVEGYAGLLIEGQPRAEAPFPDVPTFCGFQDLSFVNDEFIVRLNGHTGQLRVVYRPGSESNALFTTSACNSKCLMCSQPPSGEADESVEEHLRVIDLIPDQPEAIGITGGEPTLLGEGLFVILSRLRYRLPRTSVDLLTNGRMYSYEDYVRNLAGIGHPSLRSAIPLYSDVAQKHDEIVGARGAFDQTVHGIYNAARYALPIEIRVVLQGPTLVRLPQLSEFIYRNFPFAKHVAFMGLENMGYAVKNWEDLWVDPVDYASTLESCVRFLFLRRMNVSVYNHQLCTLPQSLWWFARKSISDVKALYLDECAMCEARGLCGGLFKSSRLRHSRALHPLKKESF